ncbi:TfuA-like protein [Devosia equisanguinis]|uniref:TfuA-like protein n=1 Tax=Devosia equisanguinis TaxID=2490941 RepID=A0A3S4GID3_9HYPH|nr:TfuA-like protein [Devosia equisanguinis]VDS05276.1 TfuA-like protein [Devosia equisanguinis]
MKIVFAGPSLHGHQIDWTGLVPRPPAALGDLTQAVSDGASMIGLIDGYFGWTASVWHKEILHALAKDIPVYGAASLGALRAAECAPFGMIPVGRIALAYQRGELDDDGDVALLHYPAEAGFLPMTEPLVDMRASLDALRDAGVLDAAAYAHLWTRAHTLNFRQRTVAVLLDGLPAERASELASAYEIHRVSIKAQDALELVATMRAATPSAPHRDWDFEPSFPWRRAGLDHPAKG